ncbi:Tetratricopeptide repeat protein [compost metagenome]
MRFCKKCGEELVQFGQKYVCPNNYCDYQEFATSPNWYIGLANNSQLWNNVILHDGPLIVAQQYKMLHELLMQGSTYGVQLKLKDLFEVILKLPTLLLISELEKESSNYSEILSLLMGKPLSFGDWLHIAKKLIDASRLIDNILIIILEDIHKIYTSNNIVSWRNERIGHGALLPDHLLEFQQDIERKIKLIAEHFCRCEKLYSSVRIILRNINGSTALIGSENICYVRMVDEILVAEFDGKEINLSPYIQYLNNSVYLFDSYYINTLTTSFISYSSGHKLKQKPTIFTDIYNSIQSKKIVEVTTTSAENDIYIRSKAELINRIMSSEDLIEFKFLQEELKRTIEENDKGYLLLEMANGMGKTTFAKMIDPLVYNRIRLDHVVCRTYYINDVYSHSPSIFVSKLSDLLRQLNRDGEMLDGAIPNIENEFFVAEKKLPKLLNTLFSAHQKYNAAEKLVLILDGIDEIPAIEGTTIFDMLPSPELLNKGVFILITCRPNYQLPTFTKDKLLLIPFKSKISVDRTDQAYRVVLDKFVDNQIKKHKLKPHADDVENLINISEGSFIYLGILTKVYLESGMEGIRASTATAITEEHYLDLLLKIYGQQYFYEMLRILISLSSSVVSLNIKQLSRIYEEEITFKFLHFVNELKPLLDLRRTANGNQISIHRKEVIEVINKKYESAIENHLTTLLEGIQLIIDDTLERELDDDEVVYIVNVLIALLNSTHETFRAKVGEFATKIFPKLTLHFEEKGHYCSEQQQQCYYLLYTHINSIILVLGQKDILFNQNDYLFLMSTICKLLIHVNMFDLAVNQLEQGLEILKSQKIFLDESSALSVCYIRLATLYSKLGDKHKSEQYFAMVNRETSNNMDEIEKNEIMNLKLKLDKMINEATHHKNRNAPEKALDILDQANSIIFQFIESGGNEELIVSEEINIFKTACNVVKRTDPEYALALIEQALKLLPHVYRQHELIARGTESDLLLNLGQVYRQLGMTSEAMSCYNKAIKMNEQSMHTGETIVPEEIVSLYNSKGNILKDKEEFEQAIINYSKAINYYEEFKAKGRQISPSLFSQVLRGRGYTYRKIDKMEEAEADLLKASKINYDPELTAHTLQGKL